MSKLIKLKDDIRILEDSDIEELKLNLSKIDISFEFYDSYGKPQASIQELLAPIAMLLSNDVFQAYVLGILTSTSYDILKSSIIKIWQKVARKKTLVPSVNCFDLDIKINNSSSIKFKLKGDIPEETIEMCINKAFEISKLHMSEIPKHQPLCNFVGSYNVEKTKWDIQKNTEFLKKIIEFQKSSQMFAD